MLRLATQVFVPVVGVAYAIGSTLDRGWGSQFEWYTVEDAIHKASSENKPIMVVVHKMSCKACNYQRNWFARSNTILNLSQNFVMVNLEQAEAPNNSTFCPDGHYVPRILFLDSRGSLMSDIKANNKGYEYNYHTEQDLVKNMKLAVARKK